VTLFGKVTMSKFPEQFVGRNPLIVLVVNNRNETFGKLNFFHNSSIITELTDLSRSDV